MQSTEDTVTWLRTPKAVRERCNLVLKAAEGGLTAYFSVDRAAMARTATFVAEVTRDTFPSLDVPSHSRWRHFAAGNVDRAEFLNSALSGKSPEEKARSEIDLTVISVLLDAGAGERWTYRTSSGEIVSRSEGLAVASFDMFATGRFSANPHEPLRVDADRLMAFEEAALVEGFQVRPSNPLIGVPGRTTLLRRLGEALANRPEIFGSDCPRPGGLFDYLTASANGSVVSARLARTSHEAF